MKTISFFSEKGGVGKSSFSIMYASWLKHQHGLKVALADFNLRIDKYRKSEIRNRELLRQDNPDIPPFDVEKTWPILTCKPNDIQKLKKNAFQFPYRTWLSQQLDAGLKDYDVVVCDFPGSLSGGEFTQVSSFKMLNLIVIPTEKDEMTIQSTKMMHDYLKKQNINHCVFINKAQLGLRNLRATYFALGELLVETGFPVLPDMVSYSEKMMAIDKVDNFRSTFGYPDFNEQEFGKSRDLGIENLFIDVTRELEKTDDLSGTGKADLSFIKDMEKTDDGRQLKGTTFPQYEL